MTTVVIVDDHALFRAGVRAELEGLVDVLADAANVFDAAKAIAEHDPDVVLLDVHMPDGGGAEVIRRTHGARAQLPRAVGLRRARGRHRDHPRRRARLRHQDDLRPRARRRRPPRPRRRRRLLPAPGRLRPRRLRGRDAAPRRASELDQLTPREREVLQHIARGYLYKEIALRLAISAKTVEAHVSSVLRKLQLSTRHELCRWAMERNLD